MTTFTSPLKRNEIKVPSLKETADHLGHQAKDAASTLGETVREKLPHSGVVGAAAASVANRLESGGKYVQTEGLKGMATDVTDLIRRNPIPALLIAVALGFCLAHATSRS
jgi:hypothetical protein